MNPRQPATAVLDTNRSKRGDRNSNQGPGIEYRSTLHQLDPGAGDRLCAEGQLGTSRDANGDGANRLPPVDTLHALHPGQPALVRARPFRALGRSRLDAVVRNAVPERL